MFSLGDYADYVRECERWADRATNEGEKELYLSMAQAVKCVALAKFDVLHDPDAQNHKTNRLH
jgi:hypothetical protein